MTRVESSPPRWAEWLLERVLDAADRDAILGDLHEEYARRVADVGRSRATAWYRGQLVGSVWPSVRRRFARLGEPHSEHCLRRWPAMLDALRSDSRIAFRGLLRRPGYAIVGVITLSIAIGANAAMSGGQSGVDDSTGLVAGFRRG